jgi:flagellar motor switch/type III secretory pathway protein FliN
LNLTNATQPTTKQECASDKKKKRVNIEEETAMTKEDLKDNPTLSDSAEADETKANNDTIDDVEVDIPNELKSDLGSYWVPA